MWKRVIDMLPWRRRLAAQKAETEVARAALEASVARDADVADIIGRATNQRIKNGLGPATRTAFQGRPRAS